MSETKQERAFALAAAISKIDAYRVDPKALAEGGFGAWSALLGPIWTYFAEETHSYWLITSDSLRVLADMDVETWAEQDSIAKEWGEKAPRRAVD